MVALCNGFHNTTLNLRSRSPLAHFELIYIYNRPTAVTYTQRRSRSIRSNFIPHDCTFELFLSVASTIPGPRIVRCESAAEQLYNGTSSISDRILRCTYAVRLSLVVISDVTHWVAEWVTKWPVFIRVSTCAHLHVLQNGFRRLTADDVLWIVHFTVLTAVQ